MPEFGEGTPQAQFLGPASTRFPCNSEFESLPAELRLCVGEIGGLARNCLAALVDLGLTDPEIARYFDISQIHVFRLRAHWKISAGQGDPDPSPEGGPKSGS